MKQSLAGNVSREGRQTVGLSVLYALIVVNLLFYLLWLSAKMNGNEGEFVSNFSLSSEALTANRHFGTLFSYMFVQTDIFHLIFNLLLLNWFGRIVVCTFGWFKLILTYIIGGLSGALLFLLCSVLFPSIDGDLIGASASVIALMTMAAVAMPKRLCRLPLLKEVRLGRIVVAWLLIVLAAGFFLGNAGGQIAHLGGAFAGIALGLSVCRAKKEQPITAKTEVEESSKDISELLEKVKRSGYSSLTSDERNLLNNIKPGLANR